SQAELQNIWVDTRRETDVLQFRLWRHKAAVSLPCEKKTREHADACIFLPPYG
ncbi:hypothetical protein HMPREF0083_04036, partial [Aneurinibacillus aneurinilyticus ATCC 12856]